MKQIMETKPYLTELLQNLSPKIGAEILVEDEYGYAGAITFKTSIRIFFRGSSLNINPHGSAEIAKDKKYSHFFLKQFDYNVPENQTFFSDGLNANLKIKRDSKDGFQFAKSLGFPVILKPNNKSKGNLVTKVYNRAEYFPVANKILKQSSVMLVERFYAGQDYRVVVLDEEVISVYKRIPLSVTGDGTSTISDLIKEKQKYFQATGRDTIIDSDDFRITAKLLRQNYSLSSVIPENERVYLLDNSNLSTGGDAVDYTNETHADYKDLAVKITKDMGLRMCGIDILIDSDISEPLKDYIIFEINSSPGLDNYVSIGKEQQLIVENLYLKVLQILSYS